LWGSAAIRDLTERRSLKGNFSKRKKMESIGTLAEESRTISIIADGYLELQQFTLEDLAADSRHQRAAEQIIRRRSVGQTLTRQMLAFSRSQVFHAPGRKSQRNHPGLASKMLRRIIGEHIEIKASFCRMT